jgi:hypothetical protein
MKVINEFIDRATGKRVLPGADFTPHDDAQRQRLVRAGCLDNTPAPTPKDETPQTFAVSSDQVQPSASGGRRGRKRSGRGKGSAS